METVIAGLLTQFEEGKLTRRQLIQSLAMAAVAAAPSAAHAQTTTAAAAGKIAPASVAPPPWKTTYLDHISYAVADYRKSAAFYRDLMGWEIRSDNGTSQATLDIGTGGSVGGIIIRNRRAPADAST